MTPQQIYQKYLVDEFERRKSRRASYSLRAFARDLQIPPPKLSQYLKGSCGISATKASALAQRMSLGPIETELFVCAAIAAHARDKITRQRNQERLNELLNSTFSEINLEKFNTIRDWYHFAILELTDLESFQSNSKWIAKALKIKVSEVQNAVERLSKLGFLDTTGKKWIQTKKDIETPTDIASSAIREFHHQVIQLVDSRFEDIELAHRDMGSMMMGINPELLPELKELIRDFQKDVSRISERSLNKKSLYILNTQLIPIYEGDQK